jgi:hypothetical protein
VLVVAGVRHADLGHHAARGDVLGQAKADDLVKTGLLEPIAQDGAPDLGGIAAAPVRAAQRPLDLGDPLLAKGVQPDPPQQAVGAASPRLATISK